MPLDDGEIFVIFFNFNRTGLSRQRVTRSVGLLPRNGSRRYTSQLSESSALKKQAVVAGTRATAFLSTRLSHFLLAVPDDLEDLPAMEHPEHITTLLLSPSLRSVEFKHLYFPHSVCEAVALALNTVSPITNLL
jgi:hypothetical protein